MATSFWEHREQLTLNGELLPYRSLRFYTEQLGFAVVIDHTFHDGNRWIEVSPTDGNPHIGLALAPPSADFDSLISPRNPHLVYHGRRDQQVQRVGARGVHFRYPPEVPVWGGIHTRFEDPDGNSYGLAGFDELTLTVESQRRVQAQKLEAERRAQEIEIAKQVQARLFPQIQPQAKTLEYAGLCLQARQVGGD